MTLGDGAGPPVIARLFEPNFLPDEERPDYQCAFEVEGLDLPIHGHAYGIDGLQALIAANTQATYALWPIRHQLRWLDGASYDESIAYCVQIADAGRRHQLRDILIEHQAALEQLMLEKARIRGAKASLPERRQKESDQNPSDTARRDASSAQHFARAEARAQLGARTEAARAKARAKAEQTAPICTRRLKCGSTADVVINLWQPTPSPDPPYDYQCAFEVTGLATSEQTVARGIDSNQVLFAGGIDSMQALFEAMKGINVVLEPWRDVLTWYDSKYEDPALFPNVLDAGRRRRIHAIIDEEIYAIEERRRVRVEVRRKLRKD